MKKIILVVKFIGSAKSYSKKIQIVWFIIRSLLEIPALVFHELSHYFFIYLLCCPHKIKEKYILKITDNEDGSKTMSAYMYSITTTTMYDIERILIGAAPLIFWLTAVVILILTHHWSILIYFIICIRTFFLSEEDITTIKQGGVDKECEVLTKIRKFLTKYL